MIRISTLLICLALFGNHGSAQTAEAGRRPYQARCASCHGDDGTGGGHGPSIVDLRSPRATSKDAVRDLILKGIRGGGMPAFQVPTSEADAIAVFVMTLKTAPPPTRGSKRDLPTGKVLTPRQHGKSLSNEPAQLRMEHAHTDRRSAS